MHMNATDRRRITAALVCLIGALCMLLAPAACTQPTKFTPLPKRSSSSQTSGQPDGSLSKTPPAKSNAPLAAPATATPRLPGQWQSISLSDPRAAGIPSTPREFRGVWVATVDNIDWPSTKFLTSAQQQAEISRIVDTAAALNFNTIVLQVRPTCDAIYPSTIEPWSEFLTGRSGRPPSTPYDPLKMWTDAAHAKGLLVHAWFNPFRARHQQTQFPDAASHVSKTHPAMVKKYGDYLWLDPGEPWVHDRAISIVRDLLSRYDLDGIHIDDYFYPYPQNKLEFDDRASFGRYKQGGGTLARDDWRRQNVDRFVERLYREVKTMKRTALVGISPFGIWRPGNPPGVQSMDPYVLLHADSRRWLKEGWLDYIAPQLYWNVDSKGQPFEPLLKWWVAENTKRRHVWPGLYTSRVGGKEGKVWNANEIARQLDIIRKTPGAGGAVHFSAVALLENRPGLNDVLRSAYATPALIPATPWLDASPPPPLGVIAVPSARVDTLSLTLTPAGEPPFRIVVGTRYANSWKCSILPGETTTTSVPARNADGASLQCVVISAVDRLGNESAKTVLVP